MRIMLQAAHVQQIMLATMVCEIGLHAYLINEAGGRALTEQWVVEYAPRNHVRADARAVLAPGRGVTYYDVVVAHPGMGEAQESGGPQASTSSSAAIGNVGGIDIAQGSASSSGTVSGGGASGLLQFLLSLGCVRS